jgi:hypothetical protein
MNKKSFMVAAAAITLVGLSSPAVAAELSNGSGQTCEGVGVWHFVNNQTGGAAPGTLTATFSDGTAWTVPPSKTTHSTQHFYVESAGTLLTATTGELPGRLVLSDYSCEDDSKKK